MDTTNENILDREVRKPTPRSEGKVTKAIEKQTAKIPSGVYLALGAGSIGLSLAARLAGKAKAANFIGLWVPTILLLGLYNKLVKLEGSEGTNRRDDLH